MFIKLGTSLRISGVQTSKSGQPQYTVVTVAQPKLMPSNQLNIGQVINIPFVFAAYYLFIQIYGQKSFYIMTLWYKL